MEQKSPRIYAQLHNLLLYLLLTNLDKLKSIRSPVLVHTVRCPSVAATRATQTASDTGGPRSPARITGLEFIFERELVHIFATYPAPGLGNTRTRILNRTCIP